MRKIKNAKKNSYYFFKDNSGNPSGIYRLEPNIRKKSLIIKDEDAENNSSDTILKKI